MKSLSLLVLSLIVASALSGCCTPSCGVGRCGSCPAVPSNCSDCVSNCQTCGSVDPCGCQERSRPGMLNRVACHANQGSCDCGDCSGGNQRCGILSGGRRCATACDACGDQSGNCGCRREGRGLLTGRSQDDCGCGSCGDQSGNCGCGQSSGCDCNRGQRGGLLNRLGSGMGNNDCGCESCSSSRGRFQFSQRNNGCSTCGDQTGTCGCGNASGGGLLGSGGLFGSGGVFGGNARQSNCPDCENGWGTRNGSGCADGCNAGMNNGMGGGMGGGYDGGVALVGGGAAGGQMMGCGRNGCGMGGNLCSSCRARYMMGLRAARHPYGGVIPHTPSAQLGGQGPETPTYVYPYYTTRGPRDFLNPNPPSIGY